MIEYGETSSKGIWIIFLILIIGVFLFSKGDFKFQSPFTDKKEIGQMVVKHFEEKYGEKIELKDDGYSEMFDNEITYYIKSSRFPDEYAIYAVYYKDTKTIEDNYFDFTMKNKIEEKLSGIIDNIYPNVIVKYTTNGKLLGNDVIGDLTVDEYVTKTYSPLDLTMIVKVNNYNKNYELGSKDDKLDELEKELAVYQLKCNLTIAYMFESDVKNMTDRDIKDIYYADDGYIYVGRTYVNYDDYSFEEIEWKKPNSSYDF